MGQDYKVKGSSIRSKLEFAQARLSEQEYASFIAQFDRSHIPVFDSFWYPSEFNEAVNNALINQLFRGNIGRLREVGEFSANKVLRTVYQVFAATKDFAAFLKRAEILHQSCYNQGGMEVEIAADGHACTITLSAPSFSDADLYIAAGFYQGAGIMLGASNIKCDFYREIGTAYFKLKWE